MGKQRKILKGEDVTVLDMGYHLMTQDCGQCGGPAYLLLKQDNVTKPWAFCSDCFKKRFKGTG